MNTSEFDAIEILKALGGVETRDMRDEFGEVPVAYLNDEKQWCVLWGKVNYSGFKTEKAARFLKLALSEGWAQITEDGTLYLSPVFYRFFEFLQNKGDQ